MEEIIDNPIIRILSNTAVSIKNGITSVWYSSSSISDKQKEIFANMMKETGELVDVKEESINPISVNTGNA